MSRGFHKKGSSYRICLYPNGFFLSVVSEQKKRKEDFVLSRYFIFMNSKIPTIATTMIMAIAAATIVIV